MCVWAAKLITFYVTCEQTRSDELYGSDKVRTLYYARKVMNNVNKCYDHQSLWLYC